MDRSCQVQLLAQAAGRTVLIDVDNARTARDTIGTPGAGRFNFKTMYQGIVRRHPDLVE